MNTNHARTWEHSSATNVSTREKQVTVKVRKRSWITKGEKILYSAIGVMIILASVYLVSFASSTYTLNKELHSLDKTLQSQQETNEVLSFEVERLSLPERITKIAKDNGFKIQNAEVKHAQEYKN